MYGLSSDDVCWQDRACNLADALIPHEVEAERAGGWLPTEVRAEHHEEALARGLVATDIPTEAGGQGCTMLQQVLVQEQAGRVTNGLGWVMATPPAWWVDVATELQRERCRLCAARWSSATRSPRSTPAPTWPTSAQPHAETATRTFLTARSGT